jgi:signal transduction histidine kinase
MLTSETIEKFTSKMIHDVRTPLTVLGLLHATMQNYLARVPELGEELSIFKEELGKIDRIIAQYRADLRGPAEPK